MATKPGSVCVLRTGRLIDVQNGFVATFNWLVSWISNVKAESGLELDQTVSDKPKFKLKLELKSGDDSNVKVSKDGDSYKIDVYYK